MSPESLEVLLGSASRAEPIGEVVELPLEHRFNQHYEAFLQHIVFKVQEPQGSELSVPFGDHHPFSGWSSVGPAPHSVDKVFHPLAEILPILRLAHPIESWGFVGLESAVGFSQPPFIQLVVDGA